MSAVAFVAVLAITCVYETRLWATQRQARRGGGAAEAEAGR